jgi:F420-0:gamma-glutamyl ligase
LISVIDEYITTLQDGDVVFITSKVVSIHEWNCVKNDWKITKKDLIFKETDKVIKTDIVPWKDIYLTIKDNILIPSAWIDESNGNGYFILYPKNCLNFCKTVHELLCKKFSIKNLWIIVTDSTARPLRWWVVGIAIYSYGIEPLIDKRWQKDIFWKELAITQINTIDALSWSAVFLMWEADETQPIVIARNVPNLTYNTDETLYEKMKISIEEDLYWELLKNFNLE